MVEGSRKESFSNPVKSGIRSNLRGIAQKLFKVLFGFVQLGLSF